MQVAEGYKRPHKRRGKVTPKEQRQEIKDGREEVARHHGQRKSDIGEFVYHFR
jgi:hypothetical protein